jgi:MFS transporter, PPP family, 3-phenylpropionic acid transporter
MGLSVISFSGLPHGLTFGLTMVGLLVRYVPIDVMARGQGNLAACTGIVASTASISSGVIFARYGQGVLLPHGRDGAVRRYYHLARPAPAGGYPYSAASGG